MKRTPSATMIVISHIQRLLEKLCQPLELALIPPSGVFELKPSHLKKNRKMKTAIAPPPMTSSARRSRLMSNSIGAVPPVGRLERKPPRQSSASREKRPLWMGFRARALNPATRELGTRARHGRGALVQRGAFVAQRQPRADQDQARADECE